MTWPGQSNRAAMRAAKRVGSCVLEPKERPALHIVIPTLRAAGCERALASILPALAGAYRVTVVLYQDRIAYELPAAVRVVVLGLDDDPLGGGVRTLRKFGRAYRAIRRHLERERADVILSCLDLNNVVTVLARQRVCPSTPIVCVEQTVDARWAANVLAHRYHRSVWPTLLRRTYRRADGVVVISEAMAAHLRSWGITAPMRVIPNPVDSTAFFPRRPGHADEAPLDERFRSAEVRLLWVGRLTDQKNPLVALAAMRELSNTIPKAQLFLVGVGELEADLEVAIAEEGLVGRVHLLGWRPDVARYMRHAHALLHTARYESFGNACFEALASGIPVVTTDCSDAFREILPGAESLVACPQGDAKCLAAAIIEALSMDASNRERARQLVETRLRTETVAASYVDAIAAAADQKQGALDTGDVSDRCPVAVSR